METSQESENSDNISSENLEHSDSSINNHLSDDLSHTNLENDSSQSNHEIFSNLAETDLGNEDDELSGIIYISRIPPYMGLSKLRSYFSNFGTLGKIYAHPESVGEYNKRIKMGGNKRLKFTHGWIQFSDKRVAKSVAKLLNNKPVFDKRHSFWREDLWNIKYLPKFKWRHLVEYWSNNKRERKEKLHAVLAKERKRNFHYLEQLEQEKKEHHIENKKINRPKTDAKKVKKAVKSTRKKDEKSKKEVPMELLESIVL
ncbi:uncharacterized protein TA21300 [Theileria annulata]|uniref:Activator of basal transcription 1 n=1 Tax=Theileria annulata TaxID=5874 RepID=Q4UGP7_THEAN|nr:uncharacterized protein TA21300 [Theileria annulata]CAI73742.1 hypothetical protein, conserved [Theileria annulata]|eukprot:XP_954419.1 hypothetical protein, conserved [Theileria annulata]